MTGLITTSIYNIYTNHNPQTTIVGIIVSIISIAVMWGLAFGKTKVGNQLNSDAILADAERTKVCIYMSVILLISSGIYEFTHIPYIDSIGTLGLSYFAFKEGKECFEKAQSNKNCCCNLITFYLLSSLVTLPRVCIWLADAFIWSNHNSNCLSADSFFSRHRRKRFQNKNVNH